MTDFRNLQFTGSSKIGEKLARNSIILIIKISKRYFLVITKGKIKLEDAGFDWKILGPDVNNVDYVTYVCDQDAYALSGQKCSA